MRNGYVSEIGFFRGIVPYLGLGIVGLGLENCACPLAKGRHCIERFVL